MKERWRDIKGFEGFYKVSHRGRVKSVERIIIRGKGIRQPIRERILSPGMYRNGYLFVGLQRKGKSKYCMIHRLVAEAFLPNPECKLEVNHKDGDKSFNHYLNLEWTTKEENEDHAVRTGLTSRGSGRWSAKLTESDIPAIRWMIEQGYNHPEIAREFGVSRQTIQLIGAGKTWRHVP